MHKNTAGNRPCDHNDLKFLVVVEVKGGQRETSQCKADYTISNTYLNFRILLTEKPQKKLN